MGKPARFQLKVRHYEVDQYGHVNHAQYVHDPRWRGSRRWTRWDCLWARCGSKAI